jgi:hypothetical protein
MYSSSRIARSEVLSSCNSSKKTKASVFQENPRVLAANAILDPTSRCDDCYFSMPRERVCATTAFLTSRKSRKAYSAALNNFRDTALATPEPGNAPKPRPAALTRLRRKEAANLRLPVGAHVWPDNGRPELIRLSHHCIIRHDNPFAVEPHAIVPVLRIPIDVVNPEAVGEGAAESVAAGEPVEP